MLDPMSLEGMFAQYGRSLLWAITAAIPPNKLPNNKAIKGGVFLFI